MDIHFGSENPIDIHRMSLSGWGRDVYMGIWNGFERDIPRMSLLGWGMDVQVNIKWIWNGYPLNVPYGMRNGCGLGQNSGLKAIMCIYIYVLCQYFSVSHGLVVIKLDCHVGQGVMSKCVVSKLGWGRYFFFHLNKKNLKKLKMHWKTY